MDNLSKTDEIILLTILRLKEDAYGVTIRGKIEEITGKLFGYGTLYSALDQLTKKGYIAKITGDPTPERGGRRKYYYKLTHAGTDALKAAVKMHDTLWDGIDGTFLDELI